MIIISLYDCFLQQKTVHDIYLQQKSQLEFTGRKLFFIHCSLYITIEREKTHAIFEKNIKKVLFLLICLYIGLID